MKAILPICALLYLVGDTVRASEFGESVIASGTAVCDLGATDWSKIERSGTLVAMTINPSEGSGLLYQTGGQTDPKTGKVKNPVFTRKFSGVVEIKEVLSGDVEFDRIEYEFSEVASPSRLNFGRNRFADHDPFKWNCEIVCQLAQDRSGRHRPVVGKPLFIPAGWSKYVKSAMDIQWHDESAEDATQREQARVQLQKNLVSTNPIVRIEAFRRYCACADNDEDASEVLCRNKDSWVKAVMCSVYLQHRAKIENWNDIVPVSIESSRSLTALKNHADECTDAELKGLLLGSWVAGTFVETIPDLRRSMIAAAERSKEPEKWIDKPFWKKIAPRQNTPSLSGDK